MSRFSHPTFRARVADPSRDDGKDEYKRTVCIVCQRSFVSPKIPNPLTGVVDEPKCYQKWLGGRADTPEARAEYLAMPYSLKKGDGGLTVGWAAGETDRKGVPCKTAARTDGGEGSFKMRTGKTYCTDPFNKGCKNLDRSRKRKPCPDCQEEEKQRKAAAAAT